MNSMEPKRVAIIRIWEILKKYSDQDHLLLQEDISAILLRDYNIELARKAVSTNLALLSEVGIDVVTTRKGCYLREREFDDSELRLLIDAVLSSRYITAGHTRDLVDKLCGLSSRYFRSHVKHIRFVEEWGKTDNQSLFLNIELIDEAIEKGKQVFFHFNRYGADKKLHRVASHNVSPFQLLIHNQRYYLMGFEEHWSEVCFFRMDRITEMRITEAQATDLHTIPGYEHGVNFKELSAARPYLYADKPVTVSFLTDETILDQIVDWFGKDFKVEKRGDKLKITLKVSPGAMHHWAVQYVSCVEILEPASLRELVKETLKKGLEIYE